jgi:hypothetical protein
VVLGSPSVVVPFVGHGQAVGLSFERTSSEHTRKYSKELDRGFLNGIGQPEWVILSYFI